MLNKTIKLIILFLFIFSTHIICGQSAKIADKINQLQTSGTVFETVNSLFKKLPAIKHPKNTLEREAQHLQLNLSALQTIMNYRPDAMTLQIPFNEDTLTVKLYQENILAQDFNVRSGNWETQSVNAGVFYRGIIAGDNSSLVAISFFDNDIIGIISTPTLGNLNLGRVKREGTQNIYALFSDKLLPAHPFSDCKTRDPDNHQHKPSVQSSSPEFVAGCVTIFFEADYQLYLEQGSSVQNTVNFITGFFNVVSTIYANENITIAISQIYVWTTQDSYSATSSGDALDQFTALRTDFTGTLAHLVSRSGGDNNIGGIAGLGVLCFPGSNYAYSGIDNSYAGYNTYSWTVEVVAHEMGHNFGSPHTHWCGWTVGAIDNCGPTAGYGYEAGPCTGPTPGSGAGTIMSYCHLVGGIGITFGNGFGTEPGDLIRDETTNALAGSCISSSCPTYGCNAPTNLSVGSISLTGATVNWTAVAGASTYTLQYRQPVGSGTWTVITGITGASRMLSGLIANTKYEVEIKTMCSAGSSRFATGVVFKTLASACPEPTDLTANVLSGTSVELDWTQSGGTVSSWSIQYGPVGFALGSGTTVSAATHPFTLSGLTPGNTYSWYIRTNCSGGAGSSTWVPAPSSFFMPFVHDLSTDAVLLTVNSACSGNIYNNETAGISAGEFNPIIDNGGDWGDPIENTVWFKFVAPASGTVFITTDISPQGTLDDTQIALYSTATPTTINHLLVSNDDGGTYGSGYNTQIYYSGLTSGSTYYIQIDGFGFTGTFCIEVHESINLPNDASCTTYAQANVNGSAAPNKWFNVYTRTSSELDIGLPVAAVKSSVNLGSVIVSTIVNSTVPTSPGNIKYMQRYYNFASTLNNGAPKDVRLFFSNGEFGDYKDATQLTSRTINDLKISHYDGTSENCSPNDNSTNPANYNTIVPVATSIGSSGYFYLQFTSPSFSEMGAMLYNSILPIELLSFQGIAKENGNFISWSTSAEKDLDYFELEQSESGLLGWKTCTQQRSVPSVDGTRNYSYLDRTTATRSFYRLAIHNLDGSVEYTDIVRVDRGKQGGLRSIVPNPAFEMIQIDYTALKEETVQFKIFGGDGRLVLDQSIDLVEGQNILPFDVSTLPAGVYYCMANGEQGLQFIKK